MLRRADPSLGSMGRRTRCSSTVFRVVSPNQWPIRADTSHRRPPSYRPPRSCGPRAERAVCAAAAPLAPLPRPDFPPLHAKKGHPILDPKNTWYPGAFKLDPLKVNKTYFWKIYFQFINKPHARFPLPACNGNGTAPQQIPKVTE